MIDHRKRIAAADQDEYRPSAEAMMSVQGWDYQFDGGYLTPDGLKLKPGVYAIWRRFKDARSILGVGESEDVRWRLNAHEQ